MREEDLSLSWCVCFRFCCLGSSKYFHALELEVRFFDEVRLMVEEFIIKCLIMFLLFIDFFFS